MNDEEIGTKLAKAMGWRLVPESVVVMGLREHWAEPAEGCQFISPNPDYCSTHEKMHYIESVRRWDPCNEWKHAGMVMTGWRARKRSSSSKVVPHTSQIAPKTASPFVTSIFRQASRVQLLWRGRGELARAAEAREG